MTRDEVLAALGEARGAFNERLHAIPEGRLESAPAGHAHSPRAVVAHIAAYDDLVVRRLRAARAGEGTEFVRDRESWELFNEQVWAEADSLPAAETIARADATFSDLMREVSALTDEELAGPVGVTAAIDPAWLQDRTLAEVIGVDCFEHYPMHHALLEAAAAG